MTKILIITAALLTVTGGDVWAGIYKCRDQSGAIMFTDDPLPNAANCTQEQPGELPTMNVATTPSGDNPSVENPADVTSSVSSDEGKSGEDLRNETEALVTRFNDARRQLYRSGVVRYKIEARRELAAIRADVKTLQDEIEAAPLSYFEKEELLGKLAVITE